MTSIWLLGRNDLSAARRLTEFIFETPYPAQNASPPSLLKFCGLATILLPGLTAQLANLSRKDDSLVTDRYLLDVLQVPIR